MNNKKIIFTLISILLLSGCYYNKEIYKVEADKPIPIDICGLENVYIDDYAYQDELDIKQMIRDIKDYCIEKEDELIEQYEEELSNYR